LGGRLYLFTHLVPAEKSIPQIGAAKKQEVPDFAAGNLPAGCE
jgi:hypothetical protein